jgi:hypothetical protein
MISLIRQFIGTLYILGILILAFDIIYYLVWGMLPPVFKSTVGDAVMFIDRIAEILSWPVAWLVNYILSFLPSFFDRLLPITHTDIFGARIAWVPIFALFIYTGILKAIDEIVLKNKIDEIHNNYKE